MTEEIARYLRATRLSKGLSQIKLSELSGVDRKTINRFENNSQDILLSNFIKITKALKVPLSSFSKFINL
jgi:transcriptional regulator with XRE-family HTH domain